MIFSTVGKLKLSAVTLTCDAPASIAAKAEAEAIFIESTTSTPRVTSLADGTFSKISEINPLNSDGNIVPSESQTVTLVAPALTASPIA